MEDGPAASFKPRSVEVEVSPGEFIELSLDELDPDPEDLLEALRDSRKNKNRPFNPSIFTAIAAEYWRKGMLDAAERIVQTALDTTKDAAEKVLLQPVHALMANIQLSRAHNAPKLILFDPRQDDMSSEKPKEHYYNEAAVWANKMATNSSESDKKALTTPLLTRGLLQLARRSIDDALQSFQSVLTSHPTNIIALLGKARVLFIRRQFAQALKLFQQALQLNAACLPDPRIGIGLCLWSMGHHEKAKAAWLRSTEVNPDDPASSLLLGLESLNASRTGKHPEAERLHLRLTGTRYIERAFRLNQRSAASANALCEVFIRKGNHQRAMKLAERTIQFADTLSVLTDGYILAGRVAHVAGLQDDAMRHYSAALKENPKSALAAIGHAQLQIRNDEYAGAIHTLDTLLAPPNAPSSLEATAMLASLRAFSRPGISASDAAQDQIKAREIYDRVCKALGITSIPAINGHTKVNGADSEPGLSRAHRLLADDVDMHAEIAHLWQNDSLDRTSRALSEALSRCVAAGRTDARLVNNLGVLKHLEGDLVDATARYEAALLTASGQQDDAGESLATTVLYNLARVYEDQGELSMAKEALEKLLTRHPEYIDGKIRQAHMLSDLNKKDEAHDLLKNALAAHASNLNLRAFYSHFLIHSNMFKAAKDFVFITLKEHDKHDVYSLTAAGWIQYYQARESRDSSSKGVDERKSGFRRAAEFYEKALQLDPLCAVAAQGLAIVTAEDALGTLNGALPPGPASNDGLKKLNDARDALDIFGKVRETFYDGSVYLNIGHCHYSRDEFDRAIESYETASQRFYSDQNVPVLLCLCRSWYAKANKEQSYTALNTALHYAQKALHIQPNGKDIVYNIAMIEQKAAEMLFAINPAKRTLADLEKAMGQATHAQKLFASLTDDPSPHVPYSKDMTDQRRKYGENMLRRGEEHLATQRQFDADTQAKLSAARQRRQDEKAKQEALERERMEGLRAAAEKLAAERKAAREQALVWSMEVKAESDEERERKSRKGGRRKGADVVVSGDEGEPRKKRRSKVKKEGDATPEDDDEEEALFSGDEDSHPRKRQRGTKKVVKDEDDVEPSLGTSKSRKVYKSKETIEDSDEDMD